MLELKKGAYPQDNAPNGEYYRYKYRYNNANSFSRSHILARHLGNNRDTAVELLTLPDLEELDAYKNEAAFYNVDGINRRKRKLGKFYYTHFSFSIMHTVLLNVGVHL